MDEYNSSLNHATCYPINNMVSGRTVPRLDLSCWCASSRRLSVPIHLRVTIPSSCSLTFARPILGIVQSHGRVQFLTGVCNPLCSMPARPFAVVIGCNSSPPRTVPVQLRCSEPGGRPSEVLVGEFCVYPAPPRRPRCAGLLAGGIFDEAGIRP